MNEVRVENANLRAEIAQLKLDHNAGKDNHKPSEYRLASGEKSKLRSTEKLYPNKFSPKDDTFRTWAEDFMRWIVVESDSLAEELRKTAAGDLKTEIAMPSDETLAQEVRFVYSHFKALMTDKESKGIVRNVRKDNGLEVWRLLHRHAATARGPRQRARQNSGW